jgi:hypothetical protein
VKGQASHDDKYTQQKERVMQQQPHYDGLNAALSPLIRQIERLDDRIRADLAALKEDLVSKEAADALERRVKVLEDAKLSRQELFALRMAGIAAAIAALVAIFDLIIRFRPL